MKIVGYQIFLRITRFVILVIRPDYQKFCLRSTPGYTFQRGVVGSFTSPDSTPDRRDRKLLV